ncbi:unnamed protein product [Dicrocoelium dendriticum]|nr:unnamed protein product [Dicrocoelium dendriticum]
MIVRFRSPSGNVDEWLLIELQGELLSRSDCSFAGSLVGDLHFSPQGEPIFIIGHHVLFGKLVMLEKPFVVTRKDSKDSAEYRVTALIRRKLLFKTRPKPIITTSAKRS